ncbi:MAG: GYD domain-containing protein [Thermoleophilia bacterium]
MLVDWTAEGVQAAEQTVDRLERGSEMAENFGCKVEHAWWTQGTHDMVSVIHAEDEQAMAAYTLAIVRLGNLRTKTLRAWRADEMREILARLPQ